MKSPLAVDKETVKEFGITEDMELSPRQKLAFLQDQLIELKNIQWRSRVDIVHATRLSESDNAVLKDKGFQNRGQHKNEVQQFSGAVKMLQSMIDELKEEYAEELNPTSEDK